ncbi:DUF1553 domain-containing protein [Alienimonas californiensis]|uniref:DUF1553 domain-containing protein n=1 Tax=Alienimonas californiensis TaxID=2527989 RepID=UPI0013FCFE8D|nr:DUF1553 domain-containing protein [Alienimonas californiensis]
MAPLLAKHCLECHSPAVTEGGLDLSQAATVSTGGDSGAAIVPGKPDESLLLERVRSGDMPLDRPPLSEAEQEILKRWIKDGARWGGAAIDPVAYSSDRRAGYDWWSLQPIARNAAPQLADPDWVLNDVDRFVLARLDAQKLRPAATADRRTLIRRLYFDLIGLPPEPEAVEAFVNDASPDAYEALVDRLLDSPHYGERWARHWLDVVRFGETQGYERNRIRDNAWRYRDWVVQAFNNDLPYDEFVRLQIAGDVLRPGDYDALTATGYHVCGTWDQVGHVEGSAMMRTAARWDHLEDLVATLGQSFLGLTVHCSRCHDHKFDPISQQNYYQMAALVGGVNQAEKERTDLTATRDPRREARLREEAQNLRERIAAFEAEIRRRHGKGETAARPVEGLELFYLIGERPGDDVPDRARSDSGPSLVKGDGPRFATKQPPREFVDRVRSSGELTIEAWITPENSQQSGPARILTLSRDSGARNVTLGQDGDRFDVRLRTTKTDGNGLPSLASPAGGVKSARVHVVYTFDRQGRSKLYLAGELAAERTTGGDLGNWDDGFRLGLGDEFSGGRRWNGVFHAVGLYSRALGADEVRRHFETRSENVAAGEPFEALLAGAPDAQRSQHRELIGRLRAAEDALAQVAFSGTAHVPIPRQPPKFHVLSRGDFRNPLQEVAPRGLEALSRGGLSADFGLAPDAPEAERRRKLAEWLSDSRNPLTARVMVNRLWRYHFGRGIVDTPSDFGFSGGRPSHPELLDWLAARFIDGGWKVKEMHRLIVTSATYRQRSNVRNEQAENVDADNRLLWRQNVHRLEGEAVRDAALAVSGALNRKLGGPSYRDMRVKAGNNAEFTDPTGEFHDEVNRRTLYRLWARSGSHPLLETLDCPDPSVMAPVRTETVTPVQALSMFNNVTMEKCGERLAQQLREDAGDDAKVQIQLAHRLLFAREPTGRETSLGEQFVSRHGLAQYCLVLLNTNEFLYVN